MLYNFATTFLRRLQEYCVVLLVVLCRLHTYLYPSNAFSDCVCLIVCTYERVLLDFNPFRFSAVKLKTKAKQHLPKNIERFSATYSLATFVLAFFGSF